jgi:anti-sigma B factor antagonist
MGYALTIEVRQEQGHAIVTAAGEIDISTVTGLRERLFETAADGSPVVVDLDQVTYIDSVGLATLVGAAKRLAAQAAGLQVTCVRPRIRELLRLTGPGWRIPLARTLDEALKVRRVEALTVPSPACGQPSHPRGAAAGRGWRKSWHECPADDRDAAWPAKWSGAAHLSLSAWLAWNVRRYKLPSEL